MANHKSAAKKARRDADKRMHNRKRKSWTRTEIKKLHSEIDNGNVDNATSMLPTVLSILDRMGKTRTINRGRVDRMKSRLTLAVNKIK